MVPDVIIHLPHSSRWIPPSVRDQFVLTDDELEAEMDRLTDHFTDRLFGSDDPRVEHVIFPVSRLVVDPERFVDDAEEPMAARGQGVIYTRTSDGHALRRALSDAERERLLYEWHRPHHERLSGAVRKALEVHGKALIIDAHSFPGRPLPVDLDEEPDRPEICLGTDPFHTQGSLREALYELFTEAGYRVDIDRPYRGTLVPVFAWQKDRRVASIMIELNRRLYLNNEPDSIRPSSGFDPLHQMVQKAIATGSRWASAWR